MSDNDFSVKPESRRDRAARRLAIKIGAAADAARGPLEALFLSARGAIPEAPEGASADTSEEN